MAWGDTLILTKMFLLVGLHKEWRIKLTLLTLTTQFFLLTVGLQDNQTMKHKGIPPPFFPGGGGGGGVAYKRSSCMVSKVHVQGNPPFENNKQEVCFISIIQI